MEELLLENTVALKLIQHCAEADGWTLGHLVGLETEGSFEVTDSFALPPGQTPAELESYNMMMLQRLKELGFEHTLLGWYQKVNESCFFDVNSVEYSFSIQSEIPSAVMIVYDPRQEKKGGFPLAAYRLSEEFIEFYQLGEHTIQKSAELNLTFANVFHPVGLSITSTLIADAFLSFYGPEEQEITELDNPLMYIDKELALVNTLTNEFYAKQREINEHVKAVKTQTEQQLEFEAKRQSENRLRKVKGLVLLPLMEGAGALYRPIPQPSRAESLLLSAQLYTLLRTALANIEFAQSLASVAHNPN